MPGFEPMSDPDLLRLARMEHCDVQERLAMRGVLTGTKTFDPKPKASPHGEVDYAEADRIRLRQPLSVPRGSAALRRG